MGAAEKVIKFENESTKIYEIIEGWFRELNRNNRDYEDVYEGETSKTQTSYETDVRLFLRLIRGKEQGSELEYLTYDELQFTQEDLEEFKEKILDMRNPDGKYTYTNKSFNRKLSAIKNFIRYMGKKKVIKDISFINYISNEKEKDNHYGVLSVQEVLDMANWIMTHEKHNKEKKYFLVLFSLDTCIRKSAVLRLKWSDFHEEEDRIIVKGIDKGNDEFRESISKEFYKDLLSIKDDKSDKVFDGLTKEAIDKLMQRYRKSFGIEDSRRIVWHSIRKTGVSFRYRVSKDIREAQRAARHKNITTTQIYLDTEDYGALGAVSSAGKIDNTLYEKVDHETLLKAISELKKDTQLLLNMKLNEILNKDN